MKKLLAAAVLFTSLSFGDCLVVDSVNVRMHPDLAADSIRLEVIAHNSCWTKQPAGSDKVYQITVGLYDSNGYRIHLYNFYIVPVAPGEKIRHIFDLRNIEVRTAKVIEVRETFGMWGN